MSVGNWIQTYTGVAFYPLDPRVEDVRIEDIAHALALQCRFAGACRVPYSVAEHSARVANHVETAICLSNLQQRYETVLAALLHDASEAYLVDVPSPIKSELKGYAEIEKRVQKTIFLAFGIGSHLRFSRDIKRADATLLATEKRDLMGSDPQPWQPLPDPLPRTITPWTWRSAEKIFLFEFERLSSRRYEQVAP